MVARRVSSMRRACRRQVQLMAMTNKRAQMREPIRAAVRTLLRRPRGIVICIEVSFICRVFDVFTGFL